MSAPNTSPAAVFTAELTSGALAQAQLLGRRAVARAGQEIERGLVIWEKVQRKGGAQAARLVGRASSLLPPHPFGGLSGILDSVPLTPENMILGYTQGQFPMDFGGRVRWHCPSPRFILHLEDLRISPKMRRDLRKAPYTYTFDRAPRQVLDACGDRAEGTWLSPRLKHTFMQLFELGVMHSVEAWDGESLVGGSFGLSIGRVWTGETMFHRSPNAGKAQFAHLAQYLHQRGYWCVDGQAFSTHFARFGARELPLEQYRRILARGLVDPVTFYPSESGASGPGASGEGASGEGECARHESSD